MNDEMKPRPYVQKPKAKPGIKTTEFWTSLAALMGGFGAAMGYLTPEQANETTQAVGQVAGGVIGLAAIGAYVWSRVQVKMFS